MPTKAAKRPSKAASKSRSESHSEAPTSPSKASGPVTRAKTPRRPKKGTRRSVFTKVELVDITSLQPYYKNPRRGDINAIADSLIENGQIKALLVNRGTKTGRVNEILDGNHTWLAAKNHPKLKWTRIYAAWCDVTDAEAARIVLVANRTSDLASYDTDILAEVLKSVPSGVGTGYSDDDIQAIIGSLDTGDLDSAADVMRAPEVLVHDKPDPFVAEIEGNDEDFTMGEEEDAGEIGPDFKRDAPDVFDGTLQLSPDLQYEPVGPWDFAPIKPEHLVTPDMVPDKLLSWAGSATKYDPGKDWPEEDQWWMYNYGIDSTSGMRDISKVIMSFFCYDDYFECWWDYPHRYVTKMLNSGIRMAVTPDFSQWANSPRSESLWNMYRNRWLGCFFQEADIDIIPNLSWRFGDHKYQEMILGTMPKGIPVVAMQFNNFDPNMEQADLDTLEEMMNRAFDHVQPELFILYGVEDSKDFVDGLGLKCDVRWIESRIVALSAQAKQRKRKTTI